MALVRSTAIALAAFIALSPAWAETEDSGASAGKPEAAEAGPASKLPADSTTSHTIGAAGARLSYEATAGTLPLTDDDDETIANIFYVAYAAGGEKRPISFVFNGGPGAAAAFLHMAALGPRVLDFTEDGAAPAEPIALSDNPDSWLPFTDLVFVDPVGTGFSRPASSGDKEDKLYYGVEQDADAMVDFMRLYLARTGRELAPVFLVGESYGGFRAVLLAHRLLQQGVRVKGAILISPALEFSMIRGDDYALVPKALLLPSITASHIERTKGIDAPLDLVREAEGFARSDYLLQLVRGVKVDDAIIARLAGLTGLDPKIIARHHGRVDASLFRREIARRDDRAVSIYDGSVDAPLPRPARRAHFDPVLDVAVTALTPLTENYARHDLGFKTDLPYTLLNREVNGAWDYGTKPNRQGFAGSLDKLQQARTLNPDLRVFIAHGYTDLITPYGVSQFLIDQLAPIETARPIELRVYRGGHMMYMRPASRRALTEDVRPLYGQEAEW
jgi:carboxypeptidase C (cathepsin A)